MGFSTEVGVSGVFDVVHWLPRLSIAPGIKRHSSMDEHFERDDQSTESCGNKCSADPSPPTV